MTRRNLIDKIFYIAIVILLIVFCVILFTILFWGFMTSFKGDEDFLFNKIGLPKKWIFNNYLLAWDNMIARSYDGTKIIYIENMFLNTILYAGGGAFFATLVPCMMAYLTVQFPNKFSSFITSFVIVALILPIVGNLPSEIQMAQTLHLYDNIFGVWLMKANFLGIYFLVFQTMFRAMPKTLIEAAKIDGAGNFTIFTRIALPLIKTTFAVIFLIKFIEFWNDYQTPLIYLPNHPTISQGLYYFNLSTDNTVATVPVKTAGAMFVLFPILIVFIAFRKQLMGNLTMGSIKG